MPVISTTREATTIADITPAGIIVGYQSRDPNGRNVWDYTLISDDRRAYRDMVQSGKITVAQGRHPDGRVYVCAYRVRP